MEAARPDLLSYGFRYELHKTVTIADVRLWSGLTGERWSAPHRSALQQQATLRGRVVPDAYLTGLIVATASRLADTLPPPGAVIVNVGVQFSAPVLLGTTLTVAVTVRDWEASAGLFRLEIKVSRAEGSLVALGHAGLRPYPRHLSAGEPRAGS